MEAVSRSLVCLLCLCHMIVIKCVRVGGVIVSSIAICFIQRLLNVMQPICSLEKLKKDEGADDHGVDLPLSDALCDIKVQILIKVERWRLLQHLGHSTTELAYTKNDSLST